MAQKVITLLTDDLEGGEADETVLFALDGRTYEIDLSEKNAKKLRKALESYVSAGRRTKADSAGKRRGAASANRNVDTAKVRAWAKDQGYDVNERGRIPQDIQEAYRKAS